LNLSVRPIAHHDQRGVNFTQGERT
jgi:hypothetical protein